MVTFLALCNTSIVCGETQTGAALMFLRKMLHLQELLLTIYLLLTSK